MKASRVVEELQVLIERHGDLELRLVVRKPIEYAVTDRVHTVRASNLQQGATVFVVEGN